MVETSLTDPKWWGAFQLREGEVGSWSLGPLRLWVRRTAVDWRYGAERSGDFLDDTFDVRVPAPASADLHATAKELGRFGFTSTGAEIELVPALADRPMVARPGVPFYVPPGQRVELYISTPIWVRLAASGASLVEVPSARPSDTWFGGHTQGALCYATKTNLRRRLDNVPLRPHRAISMLTVVNEARENLALERLSIPLPQLSLYASPSGALWTQHVSLVNTDDDGDFADVRLGKGAPEIAGGGTLVAGPREHLGSSFGSLVFGGLFQTGF